MVGTGIERRRIDIVCWHLPSVGYGRSSNDEMHCIGKHRRAGLLDASWLLDMPKGIALTLR